MNLIYLHGTNDYAISAQGCDLYRNIPDQGWVKVEPDFNDEYPFWMVEYPTGWSKVYCHRAVAETMLGQPQPGLVVNHKDGNKRNWHVSNLEWITQRANVIHAHENGLTNATPLMIVRQIKRYLDEGLTVKEISTLCNVNYQTVFDIKTGRRHAHVQT